MTVIQHVGYYSLVIANVYSAADKTWPFITFLVIAILCFVDSCFERDR